MKRKKVKMYSGKQPVSVWRITFVKRGYDPNATYVDVLPSGKFVQDPEFKKTLFQTYFVFGVDYPSALKKLDFVPKDVWNIYKFERFRELDYNLIYEL